MSTIKILKQYVWMVNTIRRAGRISFAEIQKKWEDSELSEGEPLARTTFNRHRMGIEDLFNIIIECDRSDGCRYYIGNVEDLEKDTVQNWMLSTLTVNNIITECKALHDRILLPKIPCDEHLELLVEAMKRNLKVEMKYLKYGSQEVRQVVFDPYCIKLYEQRWYVLAHIYKEVSADKAANDVYVVYAFDRIRELKLTNTEFVMNLDFVPEQFFADCYGVVAGDGTMPVKIVLRAFGKQQYYLRDLPLHPTQVEVGRGNDYTDFSMRLKPTVDFVGDLLGLDAQVQVLEPQSLAVRLHDLHKKATLMYEKE